MKKLFAAIVILTAVLSLCNSARAEEREGSEGQESAVSREIIYSYDMNDAPEHFFFPKEKAMWDGSKVTMREWYLLTEIQKERFITEYLEELQGKYKVNIDVMGMDYLKALNIFSSYSNDRTLREPSTKFMDILLSGQGKLTGRDRPKSGAQ
jgi:hypothetical protein